MIRINLLPRERVRRKAIAPRALVLVVGVALAFVVVISTFYLEARNGRVAAELKRVNEQIDALNQKVQRVEELTRQIELARRKERLLRQLEALRVDWDAVLEEVRTVMPRDVWMTQVELRDAGDLAFNGYAMSYEAVARFMVSLEDSEMFNSVDMLVSQKQKIANTNVINFSVVAKLVPLSKEAQIR
ncbi:MAG: PilN domain-containing protein [Armatimonadetes bacterium]|nr:PilN domain-containing protein [Armatimonadota bacterium]